VWRSWQPWGDGLSIYDSRIWKLGRSLLPQSIRLRVRMPIIRMIVLYKSVIKKSYSANGEDLLIKSLMDEGLSVWYLDIGAGDPRIHSNTYKFYQTGSYGVAVDANKGLLAQFAAVRPRDTTVWGAITRDGARGSSVVYWQLDPWELSTTSPNAMREAVNNGARVVSKSEVPAVDVNNILQADFPVDGSVTLLNVDVEGISYGVLNTIDFSRFPFDYVLVERDSPDERFAYAESESLPRRYLRIGTLGPTDAYSRIGAR
jgi:hypothetical protein